MIQSRVRLFGSEIVEILSPSWTGSNGRDFRCRVVNQVAEGIAQIEQEVLAITLLHVDSEPVIAGVASRSVGRDRRGKTVGSYWIPSRVCGDFGVVEVLLRQGECRESRRGRLLQIGGQVLRRGDQRIPVDLVLVQQVNSLGADVAHVHGVIVSEFMLNAKVPGERVTQLLIGRKVRRSVQASRSGGQSEG